MNKKQMVVTFLAPSLKWPLAGCRSGVFSQSDGGGLELLASKRMETVRISLHV